MFEVRPVADQDEYGRAIGAIGQYFNPPPGEEMLARFVRTLPHERMHAAIEDGQIVGGTGAFPFELSVPGGSLPCAGVTAVGVHPTHPRRGVLRAMMDTQLRDIHERGEPIAALWASEETIYGRFGYGIASWAGELKVPHEWDAFAEPLELGGTTRFVTPEEARELFPPIYQAVRRERPGMTSRSDTWWDDRQLRLPEDEAAAPRRFVVLELDGEPVGYAIYRTHFSFDGGSASSRLVVRQALGASPPAPAAARASAPRRSRTSRSTSPRSAPPTLARSRSRSSARRCASRSCGRERSPGRTRCSRGVRFPGASKYSERAALHCRTTWGG